MKWVACLLFGALVGALLEDELWYRKSVYRETVERRLSNTAFCA